MLTKVESEIYAVLWKKFGQSEFSTKELRFLDIFLSTTMKKKVLFVLSQNGWIKRIMRGHYVCAVPNEIFKQIFEPKVLGLLTKTKMKWVFSRLNALEVYTDFSVTHRSWLSSPFYINVLKKDLGKWLSLLKKTGMRTYVSYAKPSLGEYIVLMPKEKLEIKFVRGFPVESFKEVVQFAQQNPFEFEYELNYLREKYGVKIRRA